MSEMGDIRKRHSSFSYNSTGSFNTMVDARDSKIRATHMQMSISKRVLQFSSAGQEANRQLQNIHPSQQVLQITHGNGVKSSDKLLQLQGLGLNQLNVSKSFIKHDQQNSEPQMQQLFSAMQMKTPESKIVIDETNQNEQYKKKDVFNDYLKRWTRNNQNFFRVLIRWRVGEDGKIEDQLKLVISYITCIFIVILLLCGFGTTYYFHQSNKYNVSISLRNQADDIILSSLVQFSNSTENILQNYSFSLNYLNDLILSKLELSQTIYDFRTINQFPYKGPGNMRQCLRAMDKCTIYTGSLVFGDTPISLKCMDWCEFDESTIPLVDSSVYQPIISQTELTAAFDILNYILESIIFDIFVTKMFKIYFAFEYRQAMYAFPSYLMDEIPSGYKVHSRPWYYSVRQYHINQQDSSSFIVVQTPYYDSGTQTRVVTMSKPILAPSTTDIEKQYQTGKGRFMGVASIDIKISEFQILFDDLSIYNSGYTLLINEEGKLLNEPVQFLNQARINQTTYENLNIQQLLSSEDWIDVNRRIRNNNQQSIIIQKHSLNGLKIVIAGCLNKNNYYDGHGIFVLIIAPFDEVYGDIEKHNTSNLINIIFCSFVSIGIFLIISISCMFYVKRKIIIMVEDITKLNECALSLAERAVTRKNEEQKITKMSKNEVMMKLQEMQQSVKSESINQLIKAFEDQLKGISKLGNIGQNILKNTNVILKYEQAEHAGTQLQAYIDPLLQYLSLKHEKIDSESSLLLSQYNSIHSKSFSQRKSMANNHSLSLKNCATEPFIDDPYLVNPSKNAQEQICFHLQPI